MQNILHAVASAFFTGLLAIGSLFSPAIAPVGATIPVSVAVFQTSLASAVTSSATSMTLVNGTNAAGNTLSGYTCFNLDEGTSLEEFVCGTASGTSVTSMIRGIDPVDGDLEVTALKKGHKRGASVKVTDYPSIAILSRILNGDETFPNAIKYASGVAPSTADDLADKGYVDGVAIAGGADASTTVKGLAKLSTAPVSGTNPIAVGDNDTRVPTVNTSSLTAGHLSALPGNNTDIAVGTGNKYITQTGIQKNAESYAASATGNDTYVVTLSPVPTSLVNGMVVRVKPDTANTGAATLNVNSLGALAIVTGLSTPLATGDILANQVFEVIYNSTGTVWQLVNPIPQSTVTLTETVELLQGAGYATTVKDYWNFNIPTIVTTNVPSGDIWTVTNATTTGYGPSGTRFDVSSDAVASWITSTGIFVSPTGSFGPLLFNDTKKVIVEFGIKIAAIGVEQMGFGLVETVAPFSNYDDASVDAASFSIDAAGALYGHTSAGGGTTFHTENPISGVTLTDFNTYRIEFDPGVDVKFYVNGVLKTTNTTNLPVSAETIKFGWGTEGNSSSNGNMLIVAPQFAIEK